MSVLQAVRDAVTPTILDSGLYLEDVTLEDGTPKILTVVIDSDDHLNLDQVTGVTKAISEILETLSELGDLPFTLEVSSPGIERPLTLPRHWRKSAGRLVSVALMSGATFKGRIGEQISETVFIDDREIALSDIAHAQVEIEFKSLKKAEQE